MTTNTPSVCPDCFGTGFLPALPGDDPRWAEVAQQVFPGHYGKNVEADRKMRKLVRVCAMFVELPFDTAWKLSGRQTHPDPEIGAFADPPEFLILAFLRRGSWGRDQQAFDGLDLRELRQICHALTPTLASYGPRRPCVHLPEDPAGTSR